MMTFKNQRRFMGETLSFIFVCILGIITTSIYQRGDKNINLSQEEEEEEEDHGPP